MILTRLSWPRVTVVWWFWHHWVGQEPEYMIVASQARTECRQGWLHFFLKITSISKTRVLHHSNGVERCYPIRQYGRLSVYASFTKCKIMYCEQTAWPESINSYMHVDKVSSSANFHPNHQRPWPPFSSSNIWIKCIGKFIRDYVAHGVR